MAEKLQYPKELVTCRQCHKKDIDRNKTVEGVDWIMKSRGYYYHKSCYDNWVSGKDEIHAQKNDETWMQYAWDYLRYDIKVTLDYKKFAKQWEAFLKKKMTSKGIYFCLKYFYDVKNGDKEKSQGGIGIIPYIYEEGTQYWTERERRENGICARIEKQLEQRASQKKIILQQTRKNTKKKPLSAADAMKMIEQLVEE